MAHNGEVGVFSDSDATQMEEGLTETLINATHNDASFQTQSCLACKGSQGGSTPDVEAISEGHSFNLQVDRGR